MLNRELFQSIEKNALAVTASQSRQQRNSYIVPGLRMSTNYTFEVRPVATKRMDREFHNPKTSQSVTVSTKGCKNSYARFTTQIPIVPSVSAKATLCLPTESEIEVSTGPYFGGRVGVEAADGARCTVEGDANSPRDVYTLRINHQACGSVVNETTVSTFVLVQENLPILTHSTRRFLVLCTVQPDTLTVRARHVFSIPFRQQVNNYYSRLNLPHRNSNNVDDEETQASVSSADLSEENNLDFNLQDTHRRDSRMLRLQHDSDTHSTMSKMLNGDTISPRASSETN